MSKIPPSGPLTEAQARKQARKEKEFYGHLATYLVVNAIFLTMNLLSDPGNLWFFWPLLGWGIGIVSHATSVFGLPGLGQSWEERRIRELTGEATEEATTARLRRLLDEEFDERALPAASEPHAAERLQRRIEHIEAIVTSRDWDLMEQGPAAPSEAGPRLALPDEELGGEETHEARAARLARRVH